MTAIAAIVENGVVYMGADSAGVAGLSLTPRKDPKIFIKGKFIIGFTTSFRMGQLLMYSFDPPKHPNNMKVDVYMNTLFIDSVRECFKNGGFAQVSDNAEEGGDFLVGYKGEIFHIGSDFQVGVSLYSYDAAGCGFDLCLGSLHTTDEFDIDPKTRIEMALKAAETFNGGVSSPFIILSLGK